MEHFLTPPTSPMSCLEQSDHIVGNGLALRDYPTSSPMHLRIIRWIREQFLRHIPESITSSSPKCTCCNNLPNSVSAIFSMLDVFIHMTIWERIVNEAHDWNYFFSFKSQTVKLFERANIKRIKTKGISIMCTWLLIIIDNGYNCFAWNTIRIIEGSDNRGPDKRGSTVQTYCLQ